MQLGLPVAQVFTGRSAHRTDQTLMEGIDSDRTVAIWILRRVK